MTRRTGARGERAVDDLRDNHLIPSISDDKQVINCRKK